MDEDKCGTSICVAGIVVGCADNNRATVDRYGFSKPVMLLWRRSEQFEALLPLDSITREYVCRSGIIAAVIVVAPGPDDRERRRYGNRAAIRAGGFATIVEV